MCNRSASSLPKNFLPPNRIRCIQINLHHSKLASTSPAQTVLDLDIDVVLIQEPYAYLAVIPVVANIPPGFSAFHHLSNDHAYGSAILIKDSVASAGILSVMHLSNFPSCVELHTKSVPLLFASIYLRLSIFDFPSTVQSIFYAIQFLVWTPTQKNRA